MPEGPSPRTSRGNAVLCFNGNPTHTGFAVGQLAGDAWLPVVAFTVSATEFFQQPSYSGLVLASASKRYCWRPAGSARGFPYIVPTSAMSAYG
jgi:hypothetical protein